MPVPGTSPDMDRATRRQLAGLALVGLVVLVAALTVPPRQVLEGLAALADRPLVLAAALGLVYLLRPVVAWPISLVSAGVGYALGLAGLPVALAGAVLTTLPPYLLARAGRTEHGPLGWAGAKGEAYVGAAGDLRGVVGARLAPVHTDVISCGAGLAGVGLRPFLAGTVLGESPWVLAGVLAGASMGSLSTGPVTPLPLVAGAAALAALLLAGPIYGRLVGRPADSSQ